MTANVLLNFETVRIHPILFSKRDLHRFTTIYPALKRLSSLNFSLTTSSVCSFPKSWETPSVGSVLWRPYRLPMVGEMPSFYCFVIVFRLQGFPNRTPETAIIHRCFQKRRHRNTNAQSMENVANLETTGNSPSKSDFHKVSSDELGHAFWLTLAAGAVLTCADTACDELPELRELPVSSVLSDAAAEGKYRGAVYCGVCCLLLACGLRFVVSEKGASSLPELSLILTFVFWMSWYQYFSGDPFDAFVESNTRCPWPQPLAGHCPSGSRLEQGVCVAADRWSPDWSLSVHCAQKSHVLSEAARINGINSSTSSGIGMITVLLAGAYMDRTEMGRRPVIRFFLLISILVKLLLTLSCFLNWSSFVVIIIVQNIFEVMSASPMYPALNCMISDLTREDAQTRGDCFSALEMAKNMASLLALLSGYPAAMALLATACFWNIPETLHHNLKSDAVGGETHHGLWRSLLEGLQCCVKDPFLGQYLVIWATITLAVNGAWTLGWCMEQANASICRAVWFFALLLGAGTSGPLMRRGGVLVVHGVSLLAMSISWALCGLGPVFPAYAALLFWVFGVGSFGVAFGVLSPCFASLISARAPPECTGQVFGLAIVVGTLLGMPLGPLWSQVFFNPSASDLHATLPWLVSSALLGLMTVWFSVHCYIAQTTVSAVAASAAILSSEEDGVSSDRSMNPFVAFTRLFSTLHEATALAVDGAKFQLSLGRSGLVSAERFGGLALPALGLPGQSQCSCPGVHI
eukprot:s336_g21.t1